MHCVALDEKCPPSPESPDPPQWGPAGAEVSSPNSPEIRPCGAEGISFVLFLRAFIVVTHRAAALQPLAWASEACLQPAAGVLMPLCFFFRAAFKYEGSTIVPAGQGTDYEDFKKLCTGKELPSAWSSSGPACLTAASKPHSLFWMLTNLLRPPWRLPYNSPVTAVIDCFLVLQQSPTRPLGIDWAAPFPSPLRGFKNPKSSPLEVKSICSDVGCGRVFFFFTPAVFSSFFCFLITSCTRLLFGSLYTRTHLLLWACFPY